MTGFARTDTSILSRWWWTVDRWTLAALGGLFSAGILLIFAASPAVAERIGLPSFHFVGRQLMIMPMGIALMLALSLLNARWIRRVAAILFLVFFALSALAAFSGAEIKGAQRWIALGGFSLQPSEFLKPALAVVTAWMLAAQHRHAGFPGQRIALLLLGLSVGVLLLQPDLGMAVVVVAVWLVQVFLAGLPLFWVTVLVGAGLAGLFSAYLLLPHVASRIDRFFDPATGDTYQVSRALEAFGHGGAFGRGPGEGTVKAVLPDAHADFIFAVAGEEFGMVACLLIILLFAFVVLRGFGRLLQEDNLFIVLAGAGLLAQFGFQAMVNMASSVHLMPTKGMTLPFISYGGSSLLALSLAMGMVLGLTRRRSGVGDPL